MIRKLLKTLLKNMILVSIFATAISCILTWYSCTIMNEWQESSCQTFFNSFIFIPSATVFIASMMIFENHTVNKKIIDIITIVGSTTFGIFLLEQIYRGETMGIYWKLTNTIGSVPACIVWIICAFVLGFAITYILKKLPLFNKLI